MPFGFDPRFWLLGFLLAPLLRRLRPPSTAPGTGRPLPLSPVVWALTILVYLIALVYALATGRPIRATASDRT